MHNRHPGGRDAKGDPHTATKFRRLDAACRDGRLTHLDFRVVYYIAGLINRDTGDAWPRQTTIADAVGVTRRGAQLALERLTALGYLTVESQRGRGHTNRYRLSDAGANGCASSGAIKGERRFAYPSDKMRIQAQQNANADAGKGEPPFAQTPFKTPLKNPDEANSDLKGEDDGYWINCESPQGDAWRRHWRATGQQEPIRSGRTGCYVRKLPSELPPDAVEVSHERGR
jgi:helix-turn-helix protein